MIEENKQTNTTNILFHDEAKTTLLAGASVVADAVGCTMGPKGKCVLIQQRDKTPILTKDGVTVCRAIRLKDPMKRMGGDLLRDAAIRTNDVAGDGTTTSTVIAYALMKESHRLLSTGCEALELVKGLELAKQYALHELSVQAQQITTRSQVENVATISANNDKEIGTLIADAMERVGRDVIVTVEDAKGIETSVKIIDGLQINSGYLSPYFVTDEVSKKAILDDCYVIIVDNKSTSIKDILSELESISKQNKSALIIVNNMDYDSLSTLTLNKMNGLLKVAVIKTPNFGEHRTDVIGDLETLLQSNKNTQKNITVGYCNKVIVTKTKTTFIGGKGDVKERIKLIKDQIADPEFEYKKDFNLQRVAKLTGGVAVIYVGAASEVEMKEKKDRFDDALHATRAAIEEGIIPGGGIFYIYAIKKLKEFCKLKKNEFFKDIEVLLTGKRAELCNNISSAINKAFEIWQKQKVTNKVDVVNAVTDDPVVTLEVEFYVNTINLPVHLSTIKKALADANISLGSTETKEVIVEKKVEVIPEGYMKINPKTSSIISQEEIAKRQTMIKEEISSRNKHIK